MQYIVCKEVWVELCDVTYFLQYGDVEYTGFSYELINYSRELIKRQWIQIQLEGTPTSWNPNDVIKKLL